MKRFLPSIEIQKGTHKKSKRKICVIFSTLQVLFIKITSDESIEQKYSRHVFFAPFIKKCVLQCITLRFRRPGPVSWFFSSFHTLSFILVPHPKSYGSIYFFLSVVREWQLRRTYDDNDYLKGIRCIAQIKKKESKNCIYFFVNLLLTIAGTCFSNIRK